MFSDHHEKNSMLMDKIRISAELFVAYDSKILGYCAFYANNPTTKDVYITLIAVKTMYQNKHIGRRLLNALIYLAVSREMQTISLEVKKTNAKAIEFYKRNGFSIIRDKSAISYLMSKFIERVGNI